jgi:hypothetical protein
MARPIIECNHLPARCKNCIICKFMNESWRIRMKSDPCGQRLSRAWMHRLWRWLRKFAITRNPVVIYLDVTDFASFRNSGWVNFITHHEGWTGSILAACIYHRWREWNWFISFLLLTITAHDRLSPRAILEHAGYGVPEPSIFASQTLS